MKFFLLEKRDNDAMIDFKNNIERLRKIRSLNITNIGRIKSRNDDGRKTSPMHINQPHLKTPEVWTDGGFYFSTVERLKIIENKIGIFHKGNINTKYSNLLDGISLGEVGFPTLLFHAGLKFDILNRSNYFINEWND